MNNMLQLPQARLFFSAALPENKILLVAGGRQPDTRWLKETAELFPVWCADKGIDWCFAAEVRPIRLLGDGDSATPASWNWAKTLNIPIEVYPVEKDLTDLQLALQQIGAIYSQAAVVVTGVFGGRFDHLFSNIFSLMGSQQHGIKRAIAADDKEMIVLLSGREQVEVEFTIKPSVVSLLPLTAKCHGVSIDGVYWQLKNEAFDIAFPYAISNYLTDTSTLKVELESGCLAVYFYWEK